MRIHHDGGAMKRAVVVCVLVAMLIMLSNCGGSGGVQDGRIRIAVIPKGTTHEFWKAIHAGAVRAARELDVDIIWKGPLKEDDREEQVQVVETFIASQVDAIVLAPLDDRALLMPVREANAQGIPTVIIDSGLQGEEHISFVATDNYKGGMLAARRLGDLIEGSGRLIVLRYQEGSASTTAREAGFLDTIESEYADIEILSSNQYAGATTESAFRAAENLLNRYTEFDAFFAPNESSTFGSLRALQGRGLTGSVVFVGFDSSVKLVEALDRNEIQGLVLQNPFQMGYLGVKTAYAHLTGESVDSRIDTGVMLATPGNMHEPEIMDLLVPDLSEYLDE